MSYICNMKTIGIDLWGTLIKANPKFKERKQDLFEKYNIINGQEVMDDIKNDLNKIIEYSGWHPKDELIIILLSSRLSKERNIIENFINDYQKLSELYSPVLIQDVEWFLNSLKNNYELHIVSNTMFIKGKSLATILDNLGILKLFKTASFSDQMGYSKPNYRIHPREFDYFIGDNPITDGVYATKTKAKFIQIHTNNKTFKDAYNIITTDF